MGASLGTATGVATSAAKSFAGLSHTKQNLVLLTTTIAALWGINKLTSRSAPPRPKDEDDKPGMVSEEYTHSLTPARRNVPH